ncbi:MAG TPA: dethiobiotin synthase [Rhodocyclaceae bacterium]|nr:dethiobiotin synthase [Rhodocyclaceae bacterium]
MTGTGAVFVTGTDTGVGKTEVAVALLEALAVTGLRVAGMKPIASGCRATAAGLRNEDAERLLAAGKLALDYREVNPYAFAPPVSPHLAAAEAGTVIDFEFLRQCFAALAERADFVVVEGAGGWRAPIDNERDMADLASTLDLPVLLVVGLRLGCLNHALLTADAVRQRGRALVGWIANTLDPAMPGREANIEYLRYRIGAPLLGVLPHFGEGARRAGKGYDWLTNPGPLRELHR